VTPIAIDGTTWEVAIDPDWPGFAGHFPGNPLVPAAELIALAMEACGRGRADLVQARFHRPVRPGEVLRILGQGGGGAILEVAGQRVADLRWASQPG